MNIMFGPIKRLKEKHRENMQKENVIINKYYGGLGNQMFQYAFGLNLEQRGKTVIADTTWYANQNCFLREFALESIFQITMFRRDEEKVRLINKRFEDRWIGTKILNRVIPSTHPIYLEQKELAYDEKALETNKRAVSGYWQCYRYVDNVLEKLREEFRFSYHGLTREIQRVTKCLENASQSVFIHIRGGDYIGSLECIKLYGNICTEDYYKKSVSIMKDKLSHPLFYVFTNDKKYAESILKEADANYISDIISEPYEDWIDLMLMSKCKHGIIANSTFSWWGAWLIENKEKIIIAPQRWINKNSNVDICNPKWVKI